MPSTPPVSPRPSTVEVPCTPEKQKQENGAKPSPSHCRDNGLDNKSPVNDDTDENTV